jgi:hypothetical protein
VDRRSGVEQSTPTIEESFESAHDLLSFVEQLEAEAERDHRAALLVARAYHECLFFSDPRPAQNAVQQARKFRDDRSILFEIARGEQRCKNFVLSKMVTPETARSQMLKAAKLGSEVATARELRTLTADWSPEQIRMEIFRLLQSRDPEVLAALSDNLVLLSTRNLFEPGSTLSQLANHQWAAILAACQLGVDCGRNSQYVRNFCLQGMPCSSPDLLQHLMVTYGQTLTELDYELARRVAEDFRAGRLHQSEPNHERR